LRRFNHVRSPMNVGNNVSCRSSPAAMPYSLPERRAVSRASWDSYRMVIVVLVMPRVSMNTVVFRASPGY
jgi:hypothetical protein